ncbi:MAG TPA: S49 family peptidase [Thermoanaerobaculaceae bacterium]|nr:S49 family peptidase [Thermoanaerobaculaceae bacterium]
MKTRSKALLVIAALIAILVGSSVLMVGGAWLIARHVPGKALLTVDVAGPLPERVPESPFGELFGPRPVSLQDLRGALVRAATDPNVRGVRVRVGELQAGFAAVQEVRDLLVKVGKAGKATSAFMETAGEGTSGNLQYYLASGCQKVVLGPLGDLNVMGLASRSPFIRGTLDKLEILPEFEGIGDYKTARFLYTEKDHTPASREMTTWLLESLSSQMAADIAAARGMEPAGVRDLVASGPYSGEEAVKARLVDEIEDWHGFQDNMRTRGGTELSEVSLKRYLRAGRAFDSGETVAVVLAEGGIQRGESGYSPMPLLGGDVMGSDTVARAFRQVQKDHPKVVIFRIDSGGGSATASEIIRQEMLRTAREIPVVVSMGNVAASGGYWITCGANRVIADRGTITASIGVFSGHFATERFWADKLGVTYGKVDTTPNAAAFGDVGPWTAGQRALTQRWIGNIYEAFLTRVSEARKLSREEVDAMARGRVFTGEQAAQKGLVDELGGMEMAVAEARKLARLAPGADVELVYYPRQKPLWRRMMERDDETARLRQTVEALASGHITVPGPVWMPPIEIR